MRHGLLVFVSISSLFALAGCAVPSPISIGSIPPVVHAVDSKAYHTLLLPLIERPQARQVPSATERPAATRLPPTPFPATATVTSTPKQPTAVSSPTPTVDRALAIPTRLLIPAINLDAPVVTMGWSVTLQNGQPVSEWDVPEWRAAGWLKTSAPVGVVGNTVLEGHQDIDGRVFENLEYLKEGDEIQVQTMAKTRKYIVAFRTIVPEKDQPLEVRRANARWIGPSNDERLTLVTCWPRNGNTHRLILVALPRP